MSATRTSGKQVAFLFGEGGGSVEVLGGKGAGLNELKQMGIAVPPGFTLTTSVARAFAQHRELPRRVVGQVERSMRLVERETGKQFGVPHKPLLVSVRSGAAVSMPGMMDTVLNLGLTPEITMSLAKAHGELFAFDCYRRFLAMFGEVVLGVPREMFGLVLQAVRERHGVEGHKLTVEALKDLCGRFRTGIENYTRSDFPDSPWEQLDRAVLAVLKSWDSKRAQTYRKLNRIGNIGTAVNVQSMVFGNLDDNSATGVVFSCDVATGKPGLWGEFLVNAQGEDVVDGSTTPLPIAAMKEWNPVVYAELEATVARLARHRRQVVDVEFTVESGKLYTLQVRKAKLTPVAAVTLATRRVWSGEQSKPEAIASVSRDEIESVQAQGFKTEALDEAMLTGVIARGLPASPGVAVGEVVLTSQAAVTAAAAGKKVILVRPDTSPDDLPGMLAAVAFVTGTGGNTCHAAVVARGLGKPAVVGCGQLPVCAGAVISVDANLGVVLRGAVEQASGSSTKEVNLFLRWYAAEQEKLWPKPRLAFEMVQQSVSLPVMLADFYMTGLMSVQAAGSALADKANSLRRKVHIDVAERIAMYLTMAVGGEIRHADDHWFECRDAVLELRERFGVLMDGDDRVPAQMSSVAKLKDASLEQQIRFLELAENVFRIGRWGSLFGGASWADIALTARQFLSGNLPHTVFADHAVDLEHNTGSVFGKNRMIDRYPRDSGANYSLKALLEDKKQVKDVRKLYEVVTDFRGVKPSADVAALYSKGVKARLW